jgi:hypothetical protein
MPEFLVDVSMHKIFLDSSICLVFYPHFSFYKMPFTNKLDFSCFMGFFARIFKTREESGFL